MGRELLAVRHRGKKIAQKTLKKHLLKQEVVVISLNGGTKNKCRN